MVDKTPIEHPAIVPDDDSRTVEEIVRDSVPAEERAPETDFLSRLRSRNSQTNKPSGQSSTRSRGRNSSADSPPKASRVGAPSIYVPGKVKDTFQELYGQIGVLWGMVDPTCAQALIGNAEQMAASMEKLAETNSFVRSLADRLATTSAIGEVVAAHLPLVMTVYMHHSPASKRAREDAQAQGPVTPANPVGEASRV